MPSFIIIHKSSRYVLPASLAWPIPGMARSIRPRPGETRWPGIRDASGALTQRLPPQSALRLKPSFTDAWNNIASALVQKGLIPQAIDCYAAALRINPRLVRLFLTALAYSQLLLRVWCGCQCLAPPLMCRCRRPMLGG